MTALIKDLIDIPEHVLRGDLVLRLSEGVNRPDETLRDDVVTPGLEVCFDTCAYQKLHPGYFSNK